MIGWLILAAYVAVWILYGWRLAVHMLDAEVRRSIKEYPLTPVRAAYRMAVGRGLFATPTETAEAERRELEALRKLAREYGLPIPADPSDRA